MPTLEERVLALEDVVHRLGGELRANTEVTKQIREDTRAITQFFKDAQGAFRFFDRLMAGAKWIVKFIVVPIVAFGTAYVALKHGTDPSWLKALRDLIA